MKFWGSSRGIFFSSSPIKMPILIPKPSRQRGWLCFSPPFQSPFCTVTFSPSKPCSFIFFSPFSPPISPPSPRAPPGAAPALAGCPQRLSQDKGDIQLGTSPRRTTLEGERDPPAAIPVPPPPPQMAPGIETKRLRPCPSALAEASWNPAPQNAPCARSTRDAGARVSPSPPKKSPNLPGNTKAGSLFFPKAPANVRAAKAASQGTACFPPLLPFFLPSRLFFCGDGGGGEGGRRAQLGGCPRFCTRVLSRKKEKQYKQQKKYIYISRKPCFSSQAERRFFF